MTDTDNNQNNESTTENKQGTVEESSSEKNLDLNELENSDDKNIKGKDESELTDDDEIRMASDLEPVYEIPVQVSAVLGKTRMQVSDLLKLGQGTVVELDRRVGEAIDIYVNNRLVARGEVVVVENKLGVTMTEIIKTEKS